MKIMVSACLLGENCKYNGKNNYNQNVIDYMQGHDIFPVCPECLGGLSTPRIPSEIVNGIVMMKDGTNVDEAFKKGATLALQKAMDEKVDCMILQSRSPSCGVHEIYDGTFSGKKIKGMGVFARMAKENGFKIMDAEDIS